MHQVKLLLQAPQGSKDGRHGRHGRYGRYGLRIDEPHDDDGNNATVDGRWETRPKIQKQNDELQLSRINWRADR